MVDDIKAFGKVEKAEKRNGVFDVSRTTKILRRPGPKCHSMSRGQRRFYVTSRRIFVGHETFFEHTTPGNETVMTHISKPAQFETGEPDLGPTVKCC